MKKCDIFNKEDISFTPALYVEMYYYTSGKNTTLN